MRGTIVSTVKRTNSIAKSILGILLITALLTVSFPITAYAADNNPSSNTLEAFPEVGTPSDTMDVNYGVISTLYGGGTVNDNRGTISSSHGTVMENHGTIDKLSAGHAGTNYGTINCIDNTDLLSVNDEDGTILYIGTGNVVARNDGTIQDNYGNISENYGTVSNNRGNVVMHDGRIVNNSQNGTVTFEAKISGGETIPAKGTIDDNKSRVIIHNGTVTIGENTGNIEINDATVTVETNSGSITVGKNATLYCTENMSGGKITKSSESAVITCSSNNGLIYDETAVWYKIVFTGDDGKAKIDVCDLEMDGVSYTQAGSNVIFTLPPEYECSSAMKLESGDVNIWVANASPTAGDTEFTINCQKRSVCDLLGHNFSVYISNGDAACTKDGTKTAICANGCGASDTIADTGSAKGHAYGEWVITKEATESETGIRERSCPVCGATDTDVIPVLTHTHNGTLQSGSSESCTVAGVKEYYTCSCGKAFEDETCIIEIADLDAWKAEGGNGHIAAKGHSYGKWEITAEPTLTEKGMKERVCSVCGGKETAEIPVLTPESYKIISGANSEWTRGSTGCLVLVSDADFAKFVCVKVDGAEIAATNYTAVSGSTKVTLNAAYLDTLSEGRHSFEIVSSDGSASANFTVKAADKPAPKDPTSPQTGDNSLTFLWIAFLFVGSGAFAETAAAGKKRKTTR